MKKFLALVLALAITLTFAACGNDGNTAGSPSTSPGTSSSNPGTQIPSDPDGGNSGGESVQKDVINVGIAADITNWEPWASGDTGRNQALWGIYQPLMDFNNGEYIPVLLKDYKVSDDGMYIECELWDNIHDSLGNPFTAEDVKWNFEMSSQVYTDFIEMIKECTPTGDYTFTLYLNRPLRVAELKAAFTNFYVTKAAYEASADGMHSEPIGTGPYKLAGHTSGYQITYEKDENYWADETNIKQDRDRANVDTINFYVIGEAAQRTVALEQGTIDMCGSVSKDDLPKFDNQNGYKLYSFPDNLSMTLFPNCDPSSICSDLNLRLAICYSVNSELILNSVYGGNGKVMYSQVPDWVSGYNPAWESEDNYYHYDVQKAADYLSKSNYNGETLKIMCSSDENSVNTGQLINNFLTQINVKSEVNSYESSVFNDYMKQSDMWDILITTRPTGSSGFYAPVLFSDFDASRFAWGGGINFLYDDYVQEMIELIMNESTGTQENIDALEHHIKDNCYVMGLVSYDSFVVVPDYVSNVCLSVRKTLIPGGCTYTAD